MKLLPRLVIFLVVCLIAIALPTMPAQAQCGGPFIELSPGSGVPGTKVTVNGQGFDAGKYVDIYYAGTRVATNRTDSSGYFTIFFTVPEGCSGAYQVQAVVLHDTADAYFTVKPGLTVSPAEGPVGTNVTVKGQGFVQNEQSIELMYYLNDNYETIQRRIVANTTGSWETSFPIPSSVKGEHRLDAQGAVSKFYEVKDATFKVTSEISLDKPSGIVGDTLTMTGSRFVAYEKNIQILFDGEAMVTGIKADSQGDWAGSFEVPEMPAGTYSVTTEGESTSTEDINELNFNIESDIVLPPDEGHVGMNLTVTGQGFAVNKDVVIMYDDSQVETASTNDKGSFEVSFLVPESQYDRHQVIAEDAAGNNVTSIFTMESDPPDTPKPISPPDGSIVGLVGRVKPTLEWSEVSDDSGVYYRLQIATSANVTATGEFVDPVVSVAGLVETSYTLKETEALPYGTYYWIVQAVDGAENESGWTTAYSFRAGLLPLWGFIVIIIAIVVLIGALIRFLVIRRRYYY
jgi:hypothetical protein